ncbi:one cut homeobox 1 [Phyllostomus discolor]|uniref:One cut homeobox 1 n=1 Tax=Phyllostomus discolor TaxID=89673 RepID=A0A834BLI9_9CHIR|nr:one cut homeobox 1 [Phyllostomus discolor]
MEHPSHALLPCFWKPDSLPPLSQARVSVLSPTLPEYLPSQLPSVQPTFLDGPTAVLSTTARPVWPTSNLQLACKRKEQEHGKDRGNTPKKPRLVFTDVQRRTLHAIFKENKRPSKELQITISQQLGLELSTVSNFFMNARRRSLDKWQDEGSSNSGNSSSSSSTCTKA